MRYILISKLTELNGTSAKSVYHFINKGDWIEGQEYRRAPNGRIMIDTEGYYRWVEGRQELSKPARPASA